ncbi:MAG: class I SAM-dependent methyltransferase [Phycisphaerae bacterium]|nr:class I SAM-dependent methyltransferase [Phycisphaerae bacterium]
MDENLAQKDIDVQNRAFWDELCGTSLAKAIGATDHSLESLAKFDRAYLGFYPYLDSYLRRMSGGKVLEIGLGYGTVAQKLASDGAEYYGLDISSGPVAMVNHRMRLFGLNGKAVVGSALKIPFENESFDAVVTIGCLHHTGSIQKGVDEIYRVLKPRGQALVMLYNKYSLRQWLLHPWGLLKEMIFGEDTSYADEAVRALYDVDTSGEAAPLTELTSKSRIRKLFKDYSGLRCRLENMDDLRVRKRLIAPRPFLLNNVAHLLGLDWYITATKPKAEAATAAG